MEDGDPRRQPQTVQAGTIQSQFQAPLTPQGFSATRRGEIDPSTGLVGYGNAQLPKNNQPIRSESMVRSLDKSSYHGLSTDQKLDLILNKLDQFLGIRQT